MLNTEVVDKSSPAKHLAVWKECLKSIREKVSLMTFNTWFLPIKPVDIEDSVLRVQLPSQFFWEWIDEHYNTLISKTIAEVIGSEAKLVYLIAEEGDESFDTAVKIKTTHIKPEQKPASKI
jgi:chromosomal replication initiator protein